VESLFLKIAKLLDVLLVNVVANTDIVELQLIIATPAVCVALPVLPDNAAANTDIVELLPSIVLEPEVPLLRHQLPNQLLPRHHHLEVEFVILLVLLANAVANMDIVELPQNTVQEQEPLEVPRLRRRVLLLLVLEVVNYRIFSHKLISILSFLMPMLVPIIQV